MSVTSVFAWTDSTIVLSWLTRQPPINLRPTWGIEFLSLLTSSPLTVGDMSLVLRTLLIVPRGDYSLFSSRIMTSGGKALNGYHSIPLNGMHNQAHSLRLFLRKNDYVTTICLPNHTNHSIFFISQNQEGHCLDLQICEEHLHR